VLENYLFNFQLKVGSVHVSMYFNHWISIMCLLFVDNLYGAGGDHNWSNHPGWSSLEHLPVMLRLNSDTRILQTILYLSRYIAEHSCDTWMSIGTWQTTWKRYQFFPSPRSDALMSWAAAICVLGCWNHFLS
jgi:hypothetical protein